MRLLALSASFAILMSASAFAGPASDAVEYFYLPPTFEPDPGNRDRFTDPAKGIFEQNDKLNDGGEQIGCIDFVLAIDAQDLDEAEIARTLELTENVSGDTADVVAKFRLFPGQDESRREIHWSLRNIDGKWLIADIASPANNWRLSDFDCSSQ